MAMNKSNFRWTTVLAFFAAITLVSAPTLAQVTQIDPDAAIDGDLAGGDVTTTPAPASAEVPGSAVDAAPGAWIDISPEPSLGNGTPNEAGVDTWDPAEIGTEPQVPAAATAGTEQAVNADAAATYREDDLLGAAEGVFGTGSQGLASIIQDILSKQGEPNGYIVGREGGGAFVVGLRYGSGTLHHKVEGNRPVYWTGPSVGFDLGLNAGKAFVLVYNLHDTQDLYKRFGAGEGQAYLVGGFNVSYLRRGNVVLIPVRMGAGLRLGANIGYMKFSEKQRWVPF
jgi:hypothetical protein